jgi:malate synthase
MAIMNPTPLIHVSVDPPELASDILNPEALAFVTSLETQFGPMIEKCMVARLARQEITDQGAKLDFLPETADIRKSEWHIAPLPHDLLKRQVEITGPVERKMIINALNSGADVFMADFEDSSAPTWANMVFGQKHLRDAVFQKIDYFDAAKNKKYEVNDHPAIIMVRPRGLHLFENHLQLDSKPVHASLMDFGLYFFHNAKKLIENKTGPYFYLPKLESHLEARLWNQIFTFAQNQMGIPRGTIKATVLIETLPAAFEMDEILFELKEHAAGLNCGRWDYIFSFIKNHRNNGDAVLPDRNQIGMNQPFMRAYTQLLIKTCHRRGAFAMGGMAAQIPIKNNPQKNEEAIEKVRADKLREVRDGHDGTWVAHPGLVPTARDVFTNHLKHRPNQLHMMRDDFETNAEELLAVPTGEKTLKGLTHNVRIGLRYIEAWLRGNGCVPLYDLMEDAATAEISRSQIWQWIRHGAVLDGSIQMTPSLLESTIEHEVSEIENERDEKAQSQSQIKTAQDLFWKLCTSDECADFLTIDAYERITQAA